MLAELGLMVWGSVLVVTILLAAGEVLLLAMTLEQAVECALEVEL